MIEITEERDEGFQYGVLYERTRILENLRLAMEPAFNTMIAKIKEGHALPEGAIAVIEVEEILDWATQILQQPVHGMAEANNVAKDSVEMIVKDMVARGIDVNELLREAGFEDEDER